MDLTRFYQILFDELGDLKWWPADSLDEVVIGAILTQNTSWTNVERSLSVLRSNGRLSLKGISLTDTEDLSKLIRSSGFHNQKAERLRNLSSRILEVYGSLEKMGGAGESELRDFLKNMKGVGQETMDSILLYALKKPVFVMDKYTERIFSRIGIIESNETPESMRKKAPAILGLDVEKLKNFHAMLVQLAKHHCRKKPLCEGCPMTKECKYYREVILP